MDVAEQRQAFLAHQLGHALDQLGLLHLVGDLGDDDLVGAAAGVLLLPPGAQAEAAAAGLVGLDDGLARLDDHAAGREVGARHELDQLLDGGVGMLDEVQQRVAQLLGIVRRNAGRHADGDARGAVGEQVGEVGRQDHRLLLAPVVVGAEVDGVLVDAVQQLGCDLGEAGFRVAVGGGVIAVDVAEVALAIDQRVAHREILGEAGQRIVDRLVAVRVVVAHRLADDLGALAVAARRVEPQLAHGIENAPMHGLEAVAHVGQRPVHDGGERVGQVALFQRILEVHGLDRPRRFENRGFCHGWWLLSGSRRLKCVGATGGRSKAISRAFQATVVWIVWKFSTTKPPGWARKSTAAHTRSSPALRACSP